MTELNLETVVLHGVRVACDNVNVQLSMASKEAGRGALVVVPSVKRHLSSKPAQPESDFGPRYTATCCGTAVPRAGRLADLGGVLNGRHLSWQRRFTPTRQAQRRISSPRLTRSGLASQPMPTGSLPVAREMQATLRGR